MAGELEVLRTLRELRTGAHQRRESRRTHALQLLQFKAMMGQQEYLRSQEEFNEMGSRLQFLKQAQDEQLLTGLSDFVSKTGVGAVYQNEIGEDNDLERVSNEFVKEWGMSKPQSQRLSSALWEYYNVQGPRGSISMMSIADDLGTALSDAKNELPISKSDQELINILFLKTSLGAPEYYGDAEYQESGGKKGKLLPQFNKEGLASLMDLVKKNKVKENIDLELHEWGVSKDMKLQHLAPEIYDPEAGEKTDILRSAYTQEALTNQQLTTAYNDWLKNIEAGGGDEDEEPQTASEKDRDATQVEMDTLSDFIAQTREGLTEDQNNFNTMKSHQEAGFAIDTVDFENLNQKIEDAKVKINASGVRMEDLTQQRKILATTTMLERQGIPVTEENIQLAMEKMAKQKETTAQKMLINQYRMITGF